jgi:ATP-binding cassette subfamily B multidrug efflux pump
MRLFDSFKKLVDIDAPVPATQPPPDLLGFYRHFLREHKGLFVRLFLVGLGVALADAMVPVFMGRLVTLVAATDRSAAFATEWPWLIGLLGIIVVLRPLLLLVESLLRNNALIPGVTTRIRLLCHRQVMRQSWQFFQDDHAGRLATHVMDTPGAVRESAEAAIRAVWYILMYGTTTLLLLGNSNLYLAGPTALWFIGYGVLLYYFVPRLRTLAGENAEAHSKLMGRIVDSYTNILTVKLFAREGQEDDYVKSALGEHQRKQQLHMGMVTRFMFALTLLNTALLAATAGLGLMLWLRGAIGAGAIAMALPLTWQICSMASWVAWEISGIFENLAGVREGMRTIAAPIRVTDAPHAAKLQVTRGEIRLEHVTFGYHEKHPVFQDFNLLIAPGERIGLVGRSGAGKSTLVTLLLRLFDIQGGKITIDGQDIQAVTQDTLRSAIGIVTQDTALLHRSIGENILYGRPDAGQAELTSAAVQARADRFIGKLWDQEGRSGYEASIGERGVKLSGGQRQRISLARVILKNAPILILDEATSALDSEAEQAIQEQLGNLMAGKTVITIAHRLSTLIQMDRILVLDEGRIVEQGSHRELLQRKGLYADLWQYQGGDVILENAPSLFSKPRTPPPDLVAGT